MNRRGLVLAYSSVVVIGLVVFLAWSLAPVGLRPLSLICAGAALLISRQAALRDPAALTWALLAAAPPVAALVLGRSTAWLVAPLATLLLVAGELNALSWHVRGASDIRRVVRHRLLETARLGLTTLAAAMIVALIPRIPSFGGTAMIIVAAATIAGIGWLVFTPAPE